MSERSIQRVLAHSGELQRAGTLDELIRVANSAVRDVSRFRTAWLAWLDPENDAHVRILAVQGSVPASWMTALVIPLEGDAMIQEILRGGKPVVVEDARTDPRTNKDIVAQTGNRTIINIPVTVGGNVRGSLGVGSFFDEGVMAPTTPTGSLNTSTRRLGACGGMMSPYTRRPSSANHSMNEAP